MNRPVSTFKFTRVLPSIPRNHRRDSTLQKLSEGRRRLLDTGARVPIEGVRGNHGFTPENLDADGTCQVSSKCEASVL